MLDILANSIYLLIVLVLRMPIFSSILIENSTLWGVQRQLRRNIIRQLQICLPIFPYDM